MYDVYIRACTYCATARRPELVADLRTLEKQNLRQRMNVFSSSFPFCTVRAVSSPSLSVVLFFPSLLRIVYTAIFTMKSENLKLDRTATHELVDILVTGILYRIKADEFLYC